MTIPRGRQIIPAATPFYHCVSRCVRRAFLCGVDDSSGRDFSHRRAWIEDRLQSLAEIFTIDLCAYAVMSNHYHVVLRIDTNSQQALTDNDVVDRWSRLHRIPENFERSDEQRRQTLVAVWRERLGSISWFMKSLNEPLARLANKEDGCSGRFWEGRFRSQALLDEDAVLKCMAYVDLNPIRAKVADTPESSMYTSVKARIDGQPRSLAPFSNSPTTQRFALPITEGNYFELVDRSGRIVRQGKRSVIERDLPPILYRLAGGETCSWLDAYRHISRRYLRAIGNAASLERYRDYLGQKRLNGLRT